MPPLRPSHPASALSKRSARHGDHRPANKASTFIFAIFIPKTFPKCSVPGSFVLAYKVLEILNMAVVEALLAELRAVTTDLANSADIAASRMVLRSLLAAAIADAGKAERAAEVLQSAAINLK